jgi:hypothetical protein
MMPRARAAAAAVAAAAAAAAAAQRLKPYIPKHKSKRMATAYHEHHVSVTNITSQSYRTVMSLRQIGKGDVSKGRTPAIFATFGGEPGGMVQR